MDIKFSPPDITNLEINEVIDTLKSGWITTGPKTKRFEKKIAEFCGTPKAVCLNSATAGLELILRLLGIGKGDEVITSAYTYTASASVIEHVGAKIVLCDVAADSFEMDYDKLPMLITEKTKAIIPVDIGGKMVDYDKIFDIVSASEKFEASNDLQRAIGRVAVVSDAAHSFGAVCNGITSGAKADFTSFSFHAVKNLTTAEGGAVVWHNIEGIDNEWIYKQFMLWSLHGQSKDALAKSQMGSWEYDIVICGQKCNMTDILASLGLAQLDRYDSILKRRKEIILKYDDAFKKLPVKLIDHFGTNHSSSGHLYLTRIMGINLEQRGECIKKLAEMGIATNVHYKPLPMHTAYKQLGFDIKDFPNAYAQFANEITLPLHTMLTDAEIGYVAKCFSKIVMEYAK